MKMYGFSVQKEHFLGNLMVVKLSIGSFSRQNSETRKKKNRTSRKNIINFILT